MERSTTHDASSPPRPSLARHLEGWQLGLVAVALAFFAAWLALPRPVEPRLVPLPEPDRRILRELARMDRERAERARASPLAFEVRAVGELVRRHGLMAKQGDAAAANAARDGATRLAGAIVRRLGPEPLRQLRAVQTELFVDAVTHFENTRDADRELAELGGNFAEKWRRSRWIAADGRVVFSGDQLRTLFRVRWTELVGQLQNLELRPALDEFRLYYRALLEHPELDDGLPADERRLAYVTALGRVDPAYAADLGRGVLLARLGRVDAALDAFRTHLAAHEDGPWAARARNYALWAMLAARSGD